MTTALTDDVFGNLLDGSNPSLLANSCPAESTAMAADAVFTCSFDAFVAGSFGDAAHVDIVTATVRDDDDTERSDDDTATVGFNDAPPNISVAKSALPAAVGEPGGTVTFTVEVANSSVEVVTLTSLTDDVFGDLLNAGEPSAVGEHLSGPDHDHSGRRHADLLIRCVRRGQLRRHGPHGYGDSRDPGR